jgi:hypothetical protein
VTIGLMIGLTRTRVALLVAGLAWFVGLTPSFAVRLALAGLVLVALAFDGVLDEQRIQRAQPAPTKQHSTH